MKRKLLQYVILLLVLLTGCGNEVSNMPVEESMEPKEVEVMISVQRTGNVLTNIGDLEVWIDNEMVFTVDGNSTDSVYIKMLEGEHTIQTKGQGDKSEKLEFNVSLDSENEFYFTTEISNWYGVKLEERKYVLEESPSKSNEEAYTKSASDFADSNLSTSIGEDIQRPTSVNEIMGKYTDGADYAFLNIYDKTDTEYKEEYGDGSIFIQGDMRILYEDKNIPLQYYFVHNETNYYIFPFYDTDGLLYLFIYTDNTDIGLYQYYESF